MIYRFILFGLLGILTVCALPEVSAQMDFTKLTNPATLPTGTVYAVDWDGTGTYLVAGHDFTSSRSMTVYYRSGQTFTKLANPATLPGSTSEGACFSQSGQFVAVTSNAHPYIFIYEKTGTGASATLTKLSNPAVLPTNQAKACAFSPNNGFLAVAHADAPFVTIYSISGTTFTKVSDPGTIPGTQGNGVGWSPDSAYLAVGELVSPYVRYYSRSGSTFTILSNPASLPTGVAGEMRWNPSGGHVAIPHSTTPFMTVYSQSGSVLTKLSNPATLPASTGRATAWSPDSGYLGVAHSTTPFISVYTLSGTTLTKLSNPAVLPTGTAHGIAWNPQGGFVAVGHETTPFITIYSTSLGNLNPPGTPTGLTLTEQIPKTAVLNWTAPANDGGSPITNYRVYRDGTLFATVGNVLTYSDTTAETLHCYRVSAVNAIGESSLTGEVCTSGIPNCENLVGDQGCLFGGNPGVVAESVGVSVTALYFLWGLLGVIGTTFFGYRYLSSGGAIAGCGISTGMCYILGLFPLWTLLLLIVVGVAAYYTFGRSVNQ